MHRDVAAHSSNGCALLMLAGLFTLVGCVQPTKPGSAPPQTNVRYSAHVDPGTPRYEEKENEVSNRPLPLEHPPPAYPQAAMALGLPRVEVSVKIVIDAEGKVSDVRIVPPENTTVHPPVFDEAVREALSRWRFIPLTFTSWEDVKDDRGNVVDARQVRSERRPFSLDYDFFFELQNGKPVVGVPSRRD